jgi:hypothetical protein
MGRAKNLIGKIGCGAEALPDNQLGSDGATISYCVEDDHRLQDIAVSRANATRSQSFLFLLHILLQKRKNLPSWAPQEEATSFILEAVYRGGTEALSRVRWS